jgi:hypothetical protein
MLLGWAAVQSLLILFHWRELDNESKKAAVRLTKVLDKDLDSPVWIYGYLILHAPFFGYAAYRLTFEPLLPLGSLGWFGSLLCAIPFAGLILVLTFFIVYTLSMFCLIWVSLIRGNLKDSGMALLSCIGSLCLTILTTVLSLGAEISCKDLTASDDVHPTNIMLSPSYVFGTTYNSSDPLWARVLEGASFSGYAVYNVIWLLVFVLILGLLCVGTFSLYPANSTSWGPEVSGKRISLWNFGFTLLVFGLYLRYYDGQGTNKPGWTEFLG